MRLIRFYKQMGDACPRWRHTNLREELKTV
jgi:hypothetical protein